MTGCCKNSERGRYILTMLKYICDGIVRSIKALFLHSRTLFNNTKSNQIVVFLHMYT